MGGRGYRARVPFRPGLDDDDALEELIELWADGAKDLASRLDLVYSRIAKELAAGASVDSNTVFRLGQQAKRLQELQGVALDIVDDLALSTKNWIEGGGLQKVYLGGAAAAKLPFSFTQPHRAAVEVLSKDLFDDVLTATRFVDDDAKVWIRQTGRMLTGFKLTSGQPVKAQARRLEQDLKAQFARGMGAVTYRDGSRHSFGEYAEMLLRTKTGVAYNMGTINSARSLGIQVFEVLDGAECGLTGHFDPEKANGRLVGLDFSIAYPLAHPNCRRAFAPRPDAIAPSDTGLKSVQSPEARADQAAFEQAMKSQGQAKAKKAAQGRSQRPSRPARAPRLSQAEKNAQAAAEARRAALAAKRVQAENLARAKAQNKVLQDWMDEQQKYLNSKLFMNFLTRGSRGQEELAFLKWEEAQAASKAAAKALEEQLAAEKKAKKSAAAKKAAATRKANKEARAASQKTGAVMPTRAVPQGTYSSFKRRADEAKAKGWPGGYALPEHEFTHPEWDAVLTSKERSAVSAYTGSAYGPLNAEVFKAKGDISKMTSYQNLANDLQSALLKHPVRAEPVTTWRGLSSSPRYVPDMPGFAKSLDVGSVIQTDGFSSSSVQPMVATGFADPTSSSTVIYKIKTWRAANIIEQSGFGFSEAEVLFPVGSMLRVVKPFDPVTKILELEEVI